MGIDVGYYPPLGPKGVGKILSIRVDIFSTKKGVFGFNMAMAARAIDLVEQIPEAIGRIVYRKWLSQDLSITVTEHDQMVLFGVIDGDAHQLCVVACLLEKGKQFLTSIRIDALFFHGGAPFVYCVSAVR